MKVRHPQIDFTGMAPVWAENVPLAHSLNAIGIVPAHIEPYLIKVLRRAAKELDAAKHPDLLADIDTFIRQEGQHYKLHNNLNKVVREQGYEGFGEIERDYAADYERFLATKSLRWNVAYCEGFEALGSTAAQSFVDGVFDAEAGEADPRPIELWKWHLAEEYEHRTVAFRTYQALYGHQPVRAWLFRIYGFFSALRHIGKYVTRAYRYFMSTDRARRGEPEPAKKDRPAFQNGNEGVGGILRVLSPFYDPARLAPPQRLDEALSRY